MQIYLLIDSVHCFYCNDNFMLRLFRSLKIDDFKKINNNVERISLGIIISSLKILWFENNFIAIQKVTGIHHISVRHLPELALAKEARKYVGSVAVVRIFGLLLLKLCHETLNLLVFVFISLLFELSLFSFLLNLSFRSSSLGTKL